MEKKRYLFMVKINWWNNNKTIEIIENEIVNIEDIFDFSEKEIYNLKI